MLHSLSTRFRWIVFDAVGTLISPNPPAAEAYHAAALRHGSRLPLAEIRRRFTRAFGNAEARDDGFVTSETIEHERWRRIVSEVIDDIGDPDSCFEDLFRHFARNESWKCFPDVEPTLAELRRQGLRLAIASNFDSRLHSLCDGLPELAGIQIRLTSAEMGVRKPSPRFYAGVLRRLGCGAGEALMVGDDEVNDVAAARSAGLAAVLLSRDTPRAGALGSLTELVGGESPG